ncbi:hypothetical protein MLD38_008418 [Melastoma candidum]|uniref:Uncharacterized protein n=1 Tax=Melastoma candidum TaxID=119954 RepID=A0ACB9RTQ4_9MYRT|nr:hypothetical protein MLD38_008418 [Melastoma candidum]
MVIDPRKRISSCIPKHATVKEVFQSTAWKQFTAGSMSEGGEKDFFGDLVRILRPSDYPAAGIDKVLWLGNNKGAFSIKEAWDILRPKKQKMSWSTWIWSKDIPPRCSFLVWLVAKGRIRTAQFWHQKGLWDNADCIFCQHEIESRDHLFFQCEFVRKIWEYLGGMLHYNFISTTWEDLEQLQSSAVGVKGASRIASAVVILMYHIWNERSRRRMNVAATRSSVGSIAVRVMGMMRKLDRLSAQHFRNGRGKR